MPTLPTLGHDTKTNAVAKARDGRHNAGRLLLPLWVGMSDRHVREGKPKMKSRTRKLLLVMLIVGTLSHVAVAGLLSPFSFSFANSFMNNFFLFPFRLSGCF